jgi:hypothetical protein
MTWWVVGARVLQRDTVDADLSVRPLAVTMRAAARVPGMPVAIAAMHRTGAQLDTGGDVVWLSPPGAGLLPVHVVVARADFARLADLARRVARPRVALDLMDVRRLDWRLAPNAALAGSNAARALAPLRAFLAGRETGLGEPADLFAACGSRWSEAFDPRVADDEALACVRALVGRGNGSTPAGDDVLVGALAFAFASGRRDARLVRLLRTLAPSLDRLTTASSATYIRVALDASFGSHLHAFARSVGRVGAARLTALAQRVAAHGASSGVDTLAGFLAAASEIV